MNVLVLTAGHRPTLPSCLNALAQQKDAPPAVVTAIDAAPSDGSAALALSHPAVNWVMLTSKVGETALLECAAPYVHNAHLAIISAALNPGPYWLRDGMARLDTGDEVVIGAVNGSLHRAGFANLFLASHVLSQIQIGNDFPDQGAEELEFYTRCRAMGFSVLSDETLDVRTAEAGEAGPPSLAVTSKPVAPAGMTQAPTVAGSDYYSGSISVALCTSGKRIQEIKRCLRSLSHLEDPNFEVIIVDNGFSPTVAADCSGVGGVRVVHEIRRGLDNARNRAVQESAGDVIAFVDDDCEVDPGWLRGIRRAFADPMVAFVTGRVRPARLDGLCEQLFESHFSFDRGPLPVRFTAFDAAHRSPLLMGALGTGANMAFRREILDQIGGFDPALDMGTLVGGGGDLDIFARALAAGRVCEYAPDALVLHYHRETMRKLRWQTWGYGLCQGALCARYAVRERGFWPRAAIRFLQLIRHHRARRVSSMTGRDRFPPELVTLELVGIVLGPLAYVLSVLAQWWRRR